MKDNLSMPIYHNKPGLSKTWPAYILLMVSLFITIFGWNIANEEISAKLHTLFEAENSKVINRLTISIDRQIEVLKTLQRIFIDKVQVVRDVFELYAASPIKMYDGINSICYAQHVVQGQEDIYEEFVRNQGYQNYKIRPSGKRMEYYPIQYIMPNEKDSVVSSFDIITNDKLRDAIEKARDNNQITASNQITLLGSNEKGFLLFIPIYLNASNTEDITNRRKNIIGVCFIELNSEKFISSALGRDIDSANVSFSIYGGNNLDPSSLIYKKASDEKPLLEMKKTLRVAENNWILVFSTLSGFGRDVNKNMPWFILGGGIALSFLLFGFSYSLLTSRSRAIDMAERITRSQRRIVDSSQDMICIVSFDGRLRSMNPASKSVLGYDASEMLDKPLLSFVHPSERKNLYKAITDGVDEYPMSIEIRFLDRKGNTKWINWSITTSNRDQMIYMIGRDITEKKKSEKQIGFKNKQLELANIITDRENYQNEEFFKHQSLEFRTQLTSIVGFLQILLANSVKFDEEDSEFIKMAYDGAENLLELVKQILDVNQLKISDVTFTIIPFVIDEIFNNVEKATKDAAAAKGVNLIIKTPMPDSPKITGDPKKFTQSLIILTESIIENHKTGNIRLKATPIQENDIMEIVLSDSGLHEIPDIFLTIDPNVKKTTLDDKSFSIFIAKSFIEVLGGSLTFDVTSEGLSLIIRAPLAS